MGLFQKSHCCTDFLPDMCRDHIGTGVVLMFIFLVHLFSNNKFLEALIGRLTNELIVLRLVMSCLIILLI